MRSSAYEVIAAAFFLVPLTVLARDLETYERTCADIGFKRGTPAYGDCVLELDRRASFGATPMAKSTPAPQTVARSKPATSQSAPTPELVYTSPVARGDGSPDDLTCTSLDSVRAPTPMPTAA